MRRPAAHLLGPVFSALLLAAPACSGAIGEEAGGSEGAPAPGMAQGGRPRPTTPSGNDGDGNATAAGDPGAPRKPGAAPSVGALPAASAVPGSALRLLSRREYENTVRDLLGGDARPPRPTAAETLNVAEGFSPARPVGDADVEAYREAAEALAAAAVSRPGFLPACAAGTSEADCARTFIRDFGRRAFRRPLPPDEVQLLAELYSGVRTKTAGKHADGLRVVVTAMLQDPRFFYQRAWTAGAPGRDGAVALDGHDLASRLSYTLWRTMPDPALFAAAEAGTLVQPAQLRAQATRLLADPRAKEATAAWAAQWIALDHLDTLSRPAKEYPEWSPALGAAMRRDTESFLASVILEGDGKVESLLTAPVAFVDLPLARVYGAPAKAGRAELDGRQRAGILTSAAFLTIDPTPVTRGKFVREQLFCQSIPPPPPNAQGMGKLAPPGAGERERVTQHSSDPACAGCHTLMDPIGFALLSYDAIGRWRTSDEGARIDASGALHGTDVDGPLTGGIELGRRLAGSAEVRRCLARRWLRFAFARPESEDDRATLEAMGAALETGERPLRDMLLALTASPAFRTRRPTPGEGSP